MSRVAGKRRAIILVLASILFAMQLDSKGEPTVMDRQWGEQTGGLAISIAVRQESFSKSESVLLNIMLQNFGTSVVPIVVRSPWVDYVYTIRDSAGKGLPMNEEGQQRAKASVRRKIIRDLHTGECQGDVFELSTGIDLKYPGIYTVFAIRTFPRIGHPGELLTVRSNSITFQTLP